MLDEIKARWDPPLPPVGPVNPPGGRRVTLTEREMLLLGTAYSEQRGYVRRLEMGYRAP